jgi:hypothetical protein
VKNTKQLKHAIPTHDYRPALQGALWAPRPFLVGWERSVSLALAPANLLFCPMTYHIFSRFPTWQRPGPLWRSIQWVLYALFVVVFGPAWVLIFMRLDVADVDHNAVRAGQGGDVIRPRASQPRLNRTRPVPPL